MDNDSVTLKTETISNGKQIFKPLYLKHCEIVIEEKSLEVDIQQVCMEYKFIKKYAYILHNKDDTRNHYHIYLNFGNSSRDTNYVAEIFKTLPQNVNRIKGRATDMLLYLTHSNDTQLNKYRYSPSEVVANFDFSTEIANSRILGDFKNYSYAQQLCYVDSLPLGEKATAFSKLEKLWRLHCLVLAQNTTRDIDIMFVCGKSGTGKTYYAKKFLESKKYDFCVSSSSNDPFQDYAGQNAIILDDLRDKSFELEDLLKILDNNTSSSVRSRFSNKVFNGKMIVITSSVPLSYWYCSYKSNSFDSLTQLYRRIGCYVVVSSEAVTVYNGVDTTGKPLGYGRTFKNELIEVKKMSQNKKDFTGDFETFCTDISLSVPPKQLTIKGV